MSASVPKKVTFMQGMVLSLCIMFIFGAYYLQHVWNRAGSPSCANVVTIEEGSPLKDIASSLEKQHLISSRNIFMLLVYLEGGSTKLRSGEYNIPAHASMKTIVHSLMFSGKPILHALTIPEGLTVCQIFRLLQQNPLLSGPLPDKMPAEGSLLTDTIKIARYSTRSSIVDLLSESQNLLIDKIWDNRDKDLPINSKKDLVIIASMIEKETAKAPERPLIAAVFYNRLRKHMRLQSDPTVLYGIFGGEGKPKDRPIFQSDLQHYTPYNTYLISGLPPSPIANPGKASLQAAAHPASSDVLYFVADGEGGHIFSATLQQHQIEVQKWRKKRKEAPKS